MKKCQFENLLLPYLHDELTPEDRTRLANHLETCDTCQNVIAELKSVDALLNGYNRATAPKNIYNLYTKQLAHNFKAEPVWVKASRSLGHVLSSIFISTSPSFRIARTVAILLVGVFIGRMFFPSNESATQTQIAEHQTTLSRDDIQFIADYMVKSELLLLTIANAAGDEPSTDDIYLNKDIAQTLLYKTSQVQRKAEALDDEVVLAFLNHLELVLLEISNRDDKDIREAFKSIKEMVNDAEMVQTSRRLQRRLEKTLQNT